MPKIGQLKRERGFDGITGDVRDLLLLGNLKNVCTELLLIENIFLKVTTKSKIDIRPPKSKPFRLINTHCYSVQPDIAKP